MGRNSIWHACVFAAGLCFPAGTVAQSDHAFLAPHAGGGFETRHDLALIIEADATLNATAITNRSAVFNDVPFDISLAAFIAADQAVMVHAERVADGSGAANYTRFEASSWPMDGFRHKPLRCFDVDAEIIAEEHDLNWLRDRGFDPLGPVWIEQYFLSDTRFNNEVVISLLVRSTSCATEPVATLDALRATTSVRPHD